LPPYCSELNAIEILWHRIKYFWLPFSAYLSFAHLSSCLEEILVNFGSKYQITFSYPLIMTNLEGKIEKTVGNIYGLRTWIEYGLKQSKNELGWADFRFTDYLSVERWWELVFCAYLLVSLQSSCFRLNLNNINNPNNPIDTFRKHPRWNHSKGWNNLLNNLRLIVQPYIFYLINPWLSIFPIPSFSDNFATLISFMNQFSHLFPIWHKRGIMWSSFWGAL
jgi:hypothetical protein